MRISEILLEHLFRHKKLSLTGLGVFYLKTSISLEQFEEDYQLLSDAIEFIKDFNTPENEDLIQDIALATGKIRALAQADLESFIINGKQMMNISKPFIIDRLGILERNYKGEIEFKLIRSGLISAEKGKKREAIIEEVRFDDNYLLKFKKFGVQYKKILTTLAGISLLVLFFWFGYHFFRNSKTEMEPAPVMVATSLVETSETKTQHIAQEVKADVADSFYIVLEKSTKPRAELRYADLKKWGHNVQMVRSDSVNFKLRIPINAPLTDTIIHRDSLARFFGKRVWVELN